MAVAEPAALRVSASSAGATTVLTLVGDLDLATAGLLRDRLREATAGGHRVERVVLDVSDLDFLDVTGLNVMVEAQRRLVAGGGELCLRAPRPIVVRMLTLLKLTDTLPVEP